MPQRSFTWVGDVVQCMIGLLQHPGAYGETFNIGHTKEIAIYNLACLIKQMTENPSEIVFVPYEQAYESGFEDMPRRLPDTAKVPHLIGYRPADQEFATPCRWNRPFPSDATEPCERSHGIVPIGSSSASAPNFLTVESRGEAALSQGGAKSLW